MNDPHSENKSLTSIPSSKVGNNSKYKNSELWNKKKSEHINETIDNFEKINKPIEQSKTCSKSQSLSSNNDVSSNFQTNKVSDKNKVLEYRPIIINKYSNASELSSPANFGYKINNKNDKPIKECASTSTIDKLKSKYEESKNLNNDFNGEVILPPQSKKNKDAFELPEKLSIDKNHEYSNHIIPKLKSIWFKVSNLCDENIKKTDVIWLKILNSEDLQFDLLMNIL